MILGATSLLSACSSFDARWRAASTTPGGGSRWDGRWTSGKRRETDGSAHGGRLRCVLQPESPGRVAAYFHANWLIFSGNYDLALEPVPNGPRRGMGAAYRGMKELPAVFGGVYRYEATITADRFLAHYVSSYDQGTFDLHPVAGARETHEMRAEH